MFFFSPQIGSSCSRLISMQSELKRLQAVTPSSDPPEAEVQASRLKEKWRLMYNLETAMVKVEYWLEMNSKTSWFKKQNWKQIVK